MEPAEDPPIFVTTADWRDPMPIPQPDERSDGRKLLDQPLAATATAPIPECTPGEMPRPLEARLLPSQPVAVVGIEENGVAGLLDSGDIAPNALE